MIYGDDDYCDLCDGNYQFALEKLKGHVKRHWIGICNKCGNKHIVSQCKGCKK